MHILPMKAGMDTWKRAGGIGASLSDEEIKSGIMTTMKFNSDLLIP